MADAGLDGGYPQQHGGGQGGYENGADPHQAPGQMHNGGGPPPGMGGMGGGGAPHHTQIDQTHKVFVGGVAWQTTDIALRDHFAQYGELLDVALMRDRATGAPRGFGFITFKHGQGAFFVVLAG